MGDQYIQIPYKCTLMKFGFYKVALTFLISGFSIVASCQSFSGLDIVKHDTSYIRIYRDELTTRVYLSRKQNAYNLSGKVFSPWLKYKTNDNLLLGIGYTYSFLTLNLGVKMPFINNDDGKYGESSYTDLSLHGIFRSIIVDLYLQWNKGYYLANPEDHYPDWSQNMGYPLRGDLRSNIVGVNVQYLFNSSKYSYKAAFHQNEFQKKSAGSPIIGIEGHWMLGISDSAMVAPSIPPSGFLDDVPFNQVDIFNMGINGGYAYTFVWKEKLYFSLSLTVGFSGAKNRVHYSNISTTYWDGLTLGLTSMSRISLGYNSNDYYVGLSATNFTLRTMVWGPDDWFSYNTGNIRLNLVKRFRLKRPIKILRPDLWIF